jgi:hypothetical protein
MTDKCVWKKARKKPIEIEFREPEPGNSKPFLTFPKDIEVIDTLEGILYAKVGRDYVIRGVYGELYPIKKDIFAKTYDVLES